MSDLNSKHTYILRYFSSSGLFSTQVSPYTAKVLFSISAFNSQFHLHNKLRTFSCNNAKLLSQCATSPAKVQITQKGS